MPMVGSLCPSVVGITKGAAVDAWLDRRPAALHLGLSLGENIT
jgi:hypothetical protein